jgi:hypothetical protein
VTWRFTAEIASSSVDPNGTTKRQVCALAKVPKVPAHSTRGLLATIAYEQGVVGSPNPPCALNVERNVSNFGRFTFAATVLTGGRAFGAELKDLNVRSAMRFPQRKV